MANIDNYYRSAVTYTQSPPTTDTFNSSFNYSTAENLYGSNVLLYTGLIPTTNPLTSGDDGDKYAVDGIDIVEKVSVQALTAVDQSAFGFTDSRLTYLIPGSVYGITVWSKDQAGDYTVAVPPRYYDVFFYPQTGTYVIYFKDTSYEPMYRTADGLIGLQYAPAITCYRYCGPKGIENLTDADDKVRVSSNDTTAGYLNGKLVAGSNITFTENNNGGDETLTISAAGIAGTDYVYVSANGSDLQNGTNLINAYNTAKAMSPSASRIITVIVAPGRYNLGATYLNLDTPYINLTSMNGETNVRITSSGATGNIAIAVTANNISVFGVETGWISPWARFHIGHNLPNVTIVNCRAGSSSFGYSADGYLTSGAFTLSSKFINCTASGESFGISYSSNGLLTVSGTFTNCTSGAYSYGYNGGGSAGGVVVSGVFNNCTGTSRSFCVSEYNPATTNTFSGTAISCTSGNNSFASWRSPIFSGLARYCQAGPTSFGNGASTSSPSTLSGRLQYCQLTSGTFATVSGGGRTYYCIDGNGNTNNQ